MYEYGMHGLEKALDEKIEVVNKKCRRCINDNVFINCTTGMHLFIDVECLQWTKLAERLGYPDWSGMFTLSEIPVDIQFCNCAYKLIAAIEYIGSNNKDEMGHYVAHCRRISGNWEMYNDLIKNKTSITTSARTLLQKKKYLSSFL